MHSSERLSYRLFAVAEGAIDPQDVEEIWQIDQDPVVMQYLTGGKTTSRETINQTYIPRIQSYLNPAKGYGMWRVALPETDTCIGELIVRPMHFFTDQPHFHDIELGWRFARAYWGKGYASEAAKYLMSEMMKLPEVTHFTAIADPENQASIQVMRKLGMAYVSQGIHKDPLGDTEVVTYRVAVADLSR